MVASWEQRVRGLAQRSGPAAGVESLVEVLRAVPDPERWAERAAFDGARPYGRTVVLDEPGVEVMVAGWTQGRPCAPHDHGHAVGAVRVLRGRAGHRGFSLVAGQLVPGLEQVFEAGAVVRCPRGGVHQMRDAAGSKSLVTLHLYVGGTEPMVVYDLEHERTQWLAGGCGAWPRPEGDPGVLRAAAGLVAR